MAAPVIEMEKPNSPAEQVNILMVDDQPGKLLTYEAILGELGENLIKATSGRDALEQLLKHDVAVVLLDVSMPELDGFELADLIRQHPRFQRTAIIFISAVHLTDLDKLKGYQRGAVDYISVPVVPELLLAKVSVFAELHRRSRQLEKLNRDLVAAEEDSRRLSQQLLHIQDEERRRIARELHDGLAQYLAGAMMQMECVKIAGNAKFNDHLIDARQLIERALLETRTVSHLLHPPLLDEMGLESAVAWYVEGFAKRSGINVSVAIEPNIRRLDVEIETAIFRIIQECLTNVHRHSGSSAANIQLSREGDLLVLQVGDNGKGISTDRRSDTVAPGVGIAGMRERVRQLKGQLSISSKPGGGTTVVATLPSLGDRAAAPSPVSPQASEPVQSAASSS
ncbi:MAG TPA: response regulator [Candidatus Acidoferrales bacterium]|nr:response regulator [Candidatus Acidoferrales bacterium]